MPDKTFTYEFEGLSYTVTVYEADGKIMADITVTEGAMDVNAIYFGDDDYSGDSASLSGPLNMNGASLDGEQVQWDDAVQLSDPGLGPDGDEKETYLSAGDTLTISLDEAESLDDIDIFGIRATSTTTEDGSIKAVTPEDPEEPEEPEEPYLEKVFFFDSVNADGDPDGGYYILDEEPNPNTYNNVALPEGTEPTFENYVSYYEGIDNNDVTSLEGVSFFTFNGDGNPEEFLRITAPDGGFADADELLAAYDEALMEIESSEEDTGADLIAALSIDEPAEAEVVAEAVEEEEFIDLL